MSARLRRERRTISAMISIYCRAHHGGQGLCEACAALDHYAMQRLDACPFGPDKPTCVKCTVHCYGKARREQIREVMRFAGPRMPRRHPVLSVFHLLDGRRPTPELPARTRPDQTPLNGTSSKRSEGTLTAE